MPARVSGIVLMGWPFRPARRHNKIGPNHSDSDWCVGELASLTQTVRAHEAV